MNVKEKIENLLKIREKLAKQRVIAKKTCETMFAIKLLNKESVKKKGYDKYKSVNAIDSVICDIDCKIANLELAK